MLGPYGVDVVPQTRACTIAGELGLALLVLEGGLHVDLQTLREVGGVASRVAVAGTALPALAAWGLLALLPAFTALPAASTCRSSFARLRLRMTLAAQSA